MFSGTFCITIQNSNSQNEIEMFFIFSNNFIDNGLETGEFSELVMKKKKCKQKDPKEAGNEAVLPTYK